MLRISAANLEKARQNPLSYARHLANSLTKKEGGGHGILQCWQDEARDVHRGQKSIKQALNDLALTYSQKFVHNPKNLSKEEKLLAAFEPYCIAYDRLGLNFLYTKKRISMQLHDSVILSGDTPWVTKKNDEYFIFQPLWKPLSEWKDELKHPLFQSYLAKYCFNCSTDAVNVGIYSIPGEKFEFIKYSEKEIKQTIIETKYLFTVINNEYEKTIAKK